MTENASVQNRSWFVDSRLTRENGLHRAVAVEWMGRYCLFVNGHAYVLDSRQSKTYREHSGSTYGYECFYWTDIPAVCVCESDGALFFGTKDGLLCRFNTDLGDDSGIYRDKPSEDSEEPIRAYWTTAVSDDGYIGRWKKIVSRQCALSLRSGGGGSSLSLDMSIDGEAWKNLVSFEPWGRFSFDVVDFSLFSFETVHIPRALGVEKKPGRYTAVAMRISNSDMGQNLICDGVTRSFCIDKKLKG